MALGGLEDASVKYWDEGSMIAVLEFEVEQTTKAGQEQANKEKKEKKKKGWPSV
jgi:RNA-binding protein 5/10